MVLIMEVVNCTGRHCWMFLALLIVFSAGARANANSVYSPCMDTTVLKNDGFTFGLAIASNRSFFLNRIQMSPCDLRLQDSLMDGKVALFRPKVDEISLLLVNYTEFNPVSIIFLTFYMFSWLRGTLTVHKRLYKELNRFASHSVSVRSRKVAVVFGGILLFHTSSIVIGWRFCL